MALDRSLEQDLTQEEKQEAVTAENARFPEIEARVGRWNLEVEAIKIFIIVFLIFLAISVIELIRRFMEGRFGRRLTQI